MGIYGISLASTISSSLALFPMLIFPLFVPDIREAISLPTRKVFNDMGEYLNKAIPIMFMQCFEWWAFELIVLMSGAIGVIELAVQTFAISIIVLFYNIPMGYQTAVTFKIGREIGKQNISRAITYKDVATKIAIVQIFLSFLLFYGLNKYFISFLTSNGAVLKVWDESIFVISLQLVPD